MNRIVQVVSTGGSMVLVGAGAWGALAYSGVYSAQQEQSSVQKAYDTHSSARTNAEQALARTRDAAASLQREQEQHQQDLTSTDAELKATRQKLQQLEAARETAQSVLIENAATIQEAHRKAKDLEKQMEQSLQSMQGLTAKLTAANEKVAKARETLNPLRSPLLKGYFDDR